MNKTHFLLQPPSTASSLELSVNSPFTHGHVLRSCYSSSCRVLSQEPSQQLQGLRGQLVWYSSQWSSSDLPLFNLLPEITRPALMRTLYGYVAYCAFQPAPSL